VTAKEFEKLYGLERRGNHGTDPNLCSGLFVKDDGTKCKVLFGSERACMSAHVRLFAAEIVGNLEIMAPSHGTDPAWGLHIRLANPFDPEPAPTAAPPEEPAEPAVPSLPVELL
jgi:hypothetical protein